MKKKLFALLLAVAMIIPAATTLAQGDGATTISILRVVPPAETDVNGTVQIVVAAQDSTTHLPVPNLTAANFIVREGNTTVTPTVASGTDKVYVAIMIDVSGSMGQQIPGGSGQSKLDAAKLAAQNFLSHLNDNDSAALYTFSDNLTTISDFDKPSNVSRTISNNIKAGGNTCLYDSTLRVIQSMDRFGANPDGTKAIVLLTDGVDEVARGGPCSTSNLSSVIDLAINSKVHIFTSGLAPNVNDHDLGNAGDETGGNYARVADSTQLSNRFNAIATQLKQHYTLTYNSTAAAGRHGLDVKLLAGGNQPDATAEFDMPDLAPRSNGLNMTGSLSNCTQQTLQDGSCKAQGIITLTLKPDPPARVSSADVLVNGATLPATVGNQFVYRLDTSKFLSNSVTTTLQVEINYYSPLGKKTSQTIKLTALPTSGGPLIATPAEGETPAATPIQTGTTGNTPPNWLLLAIIGAAALLLLILIIFLVLRSRRASRQPEFYTQDSTFQPPAFDPDNLVTEVRDPSYSGEGDSTFQPAARLLWHDSSGTALAPPFYLEESVLSSRGAVIGRTPGDGFLDIRLDGVERTISRNHASIRLRDGIFYITDNSPNGVSVAGRHIPRGQPIELPGDCEIVLAPGLANAQFSFTSMLRGAGGAPASQNGSRIASVTDTSDISGQGRAN